MATNLLTANPELNYIYAWWDPGAAAAVKAIEAKGKLGKIGVASQNGDCIALGLVIKGNADGDRRVLPVGDRRRRCHDRGRRDQGQEAAEVDGRRPCSA